MALAKSGAVHTAVKALCTCLQARAEASECDLSVRILNLSSEPYFKIDCSEISAHQKIALTGLINALIASLQDIPLIEKTSLTLSFYQASSIDCEMEVEMLAGSHHADLDDAPGLLRLITSHLVNTQAMQPCTEPENTYWVKSRRYGEDASQAVHAASPRQAVRLFALMSNPEDTLMSVMDTISSVYLVCPRNDWRDSNIMWSAHSKSGYLNL